MTLRVRLFDRAAAPMPGVAFRATIGERAMRDNAERRGLATVHNAIAPNACVLAWSPAPFGDAKPAAPGDTHGDAYIPEFGAELLLG